MHHFRFIVCLFAISLAHVSAASADELKAGVAVSDITPPIPFRMSGYFTERLSTGTKDPLHAKALVLQQGHESAALVFCDVVGASHLIVGEARAKASAATGIPAANIAIAATHSHTGPLYYGALSDFLHQRNIEKLGGDPYDPMPYRATLVAQIVDAVVKAKADLKPVEMKSGYAIEDRLSFNRRFHMKDGSVAFNPGQQNPNIVRVAGPTDPQVGIVTFGAPGADKPSAALVSFAMHLDTVGGAEYSADYPKYVEDVLRKQYGDVFTLLFGAGTCGDINHIDVKRLDRRDTATIGTMLGETVEKAIQGDTLASADEPTLAVRSTTIDAALQSFSEGEISQARENMKLVGTRDLPFLAQVEAYKILDVQRRLGKSIALDVKAFRLSKDTAIVTLPAEVFVEIGLAIKAASPFKTTLVIELTNDSLGYIPTKKAFAEGSYETVNSRIVPGTGEELVEAAMKLLKALE